MTHPTQHDEQLLIDYALGRCEADQAQALRRRLQEDAALAALHQDIRNALAAMALVPILEPPAGLAQRTVNRLRQVHATEALIARAELGRRPASRSRFSLRELAAVASVVLLLGLGFYLTLGRGDQSLQARQLATLCEARLGDIGRAAHAYAEENDSFLPVSAPVAGAWLASPGQEVLSNSTGLFQLIRLNYAPAEAFQCPGTTGPAPAGFAVMAGMTDFPQGKFIGYSYQHALGRGLSLNDPVLRAAAAEMAILADSNPLFTGGRFHPGRAATAVSDNHDGRGQNVLYLDNHVRWAATPTVGVGGNNIYLAEGVLQYRGDEAPVSPTDTFLLPAYSRN
ncbi:MAG: hypothetical protein MUP47_05040 [Phycisphaerae bacterium]|nr:hypothetical protein [Phycisphaerae bacterium]